jgi:dethiobiotin synthetase
MWISDNVFISDTETNVEGKTVFTTADYEKLYFSMRIDVSAVSF